MTTNLLILMSSSMILILIVAIAAYYFFWLNKKDEPSEDAPEDESENTSVFSDAIENIDFEGNDIKCHNNIDDYDTKCEDECKDNADCAAYVTLQNNKTCCSKTIDALKGDNVKLHRDNSNVKFYTKRKLLNKYIGKMDKDIPGHDIKQFGQLKDNIPALSIICSAIPECKSFNSHGWIKTINTESELQDNDDYNIFFKQ